MIKNFCTHFHEYSNYTDWYTYATDDMARLYAEYIEQGKISVEEVEYEKIFLNTCHREALAHIGTYTDASGKLREKFSSPRWSYRQMDEVRRDALRYYTKRLEEERKSAFQRISSYKMSEGFSLNHSLYLVSHYLAPSEANLMRSCLYVLEFLYNFIHHLPNGILVDFADRIGGQGKSLNISGLVNAVKELGLKGTFSPSLPSIHTVSSIWCENDMVGVPEGRFDRESFVEMNNVLDKNVITIKGKYIKEWKAVSSANIITASNFIPSEGNMRRYLIRQVNIECFLNDCLGREDLDIAPSVEEQREKVTQAWKDLIIFVSKLSKDNYSRLCRMFASGEMENDSEVTNIVRTYLEECGENFSATPSELIKNFEMSIEKDFEISHKRVLKRKLYSKALFYRLKRDFSKNRNTGEYGSYDWSTFPIKEDVYDPSPTSCYHWFHREDGIWGSEEMKGILSSILLLSDEQESSHVAHTNIREGEHDGENTVIQNIGEDSSKRDIFEKDTPERSSPERSSLERSSPERSIFCEEDVFESIPCDDDYDDSDDNGINEIIGDENELGDEIMEIREDSPRENFPRENFPRENFPGENSPQYSPQNHSVFSPLKIEKGEPITKLITFNFANGAHTMKTNIKCEDILASSSNTYMMSNMSMLNSSKWERNEKGCVKFCDNNFQNSIFLFESDEESMERQREKAQELRDIVFTATFSGNKSIHFLLRTSYNEDNKEKRYFLWKRLREIYFPDMKMDEQVKNNARITRKPNGMRENGERQSVLYYNLDNIIDVSPLEKEYELWKERERNFVYQRNFSQKDSSYNEGNEYEKLDRMVQKRSRSEAFMLGYNVLKYNICPKGGNYIGAAMSLMKCGFSDSLVREMLMRASSSHPSNINPNNVEAILEEFRRRCEACS